jgi:hypothetical protein
MVQYRVQRRAFVNIYCIFGFHKSAKFLGHLSNFQLLTKDTPSWHLVRKVVLSVMGYCQILGLSSGGKQIKYTLYNYQSILLHTALGQNPLFVAAFCLTGCRTGWEHNAVPPQSLGQPMQESTWDRFRPAEPIIRHLGDLSGHSLLYHAVHQRLPLN